MHEPRGHKDGRCKDPQLRLAVAVAWPRLARLRVHRVGHRGLRARYSARAGSCSRIHNRLLRGFCEHLRWRRARNRLGRGVVVDGGQHPWVVFEEHTQRDLGEARALAGGGQRGLCRLPLIRRALELNLANPSVIEAMLGTSPRASELGADRGVLDVAREAAWQERQAPINHDRAQLRTRLVLVFRTREVVF